MKCRKLDVWRRSTLLSVRVYRHFASSRDYSFKDQITRSSLSIPSNLAEGAERRSDKESRHFFNIAKGSCAELYTQVFIGKEIGYIDEPLASELIAEIEQISAMIAGLIKHISRTS